jgi:hypothetical protein
MVGAKGFEPSTSWSRTRRASQAALRPDSEALRGKENTRRDTKNSTGYEGRPANLSLPWQQSFTSGNTPNHSALTKKPPERMRSPAGIGTTV